MMMTSGLEEGFCIKELQHQKLDDYELKSCDCLIYFFFCCLPLSMMSTVPSWNYLLPHATKSPTKQDTFPCDTQRVLSISIPIKNKGF